MSDYVLLKGDCLEVLKDLPDDSVDSLVTDPPAGISFMGKSWDEDKGGRKQWVAWMSEVMKECLRVLKPGAHGLVWAIPRTSHWTATALEDAGFEIRDVVTHLFGSGFPKSMDISKAVDKAAGAERKIISTKKKTPSYKTNITNTDSINWDYGSSNLTYNAPITAPSTTEAKQWQGWGTSLKPASEHWILVRKPIEEKTVAANVLKHGTGGINIDASRIKTTEKLQDSTVRDDIRGGSFAKGHTPNPGDIPSYSQQSGGRFPANLVLSHNLDCVDKCTEGCAVKLLDEQSGDRPVSGSAKLGKPHQGEFKAGFLGKAGQRSQRLSPNDFGGASRFFYCAKASKADKNEGCDLTQTKAVGARPNSSDMSGKFPDHDQRERVGNFHPTVKSTKLMTYLITLITPPNGIVLDPFVGSGSTGVAALKKDFTFLGIEKEDEYYTIAESRLEAARKSNDNSDDEAA